MSLDVFGRTVDNPDFKKQKVAGVPRNKYEFYIFPKGADGKGVPANAVFVAGFNSITGLDADIEQLNWQTGDSEVELKLPGKITHPNITLERGYVADEHLLRSWFNQRGHVYGKSDNYMLDCGIVVKSASGEVVRLVLVSNGWLAKYKPGDLQADSMDPWVESIEIAHEGWAFGNDTFPGKSGTYDFTGKGDRVWDAVASAYTDITAAVLFKTDV